MTYLVLSGLFLGAAIVVAAGVAVARRPGRRWWLSTALTAIALLALTAAFDNVMIAADLFTYSDDAISGVHVGLAPVEDFAWPLAAVALLPALWLVLGRRDR